MTCKRAPVKNSIFKIYVCTGRSSLNYPNQFHSLQPGEVSSGSSRSERGTHQASEEVDQQFNNRRLLLRVRNHRKPLPHVGSTPHMSHASRERRSRRGTPESNRPVRCSPARDRDVPFVQTVLRAVGVPREAGGATLGCVGDTSRVHAQHRAL